ncbi:enoyl-CoA hydratase-related protein [Anaeromyxobacter paludicola]|uniref:Crotonase n=1 Tax=Anaeromyxobacter paludicola TaxID=2918171 RepID=A0ABM7X713_9BACT|nr:enoyl-CoA hydratase-related protein [Anaeromyxobacter paludicola]BDG07624.1 crotonase [Anaeromyxobacter paludicola]
MDVTNPENVSFEVTDGIGVLTVARERALNALNDKTLHEILGVLDQVRIDRNVRALVLTGRGEKAFVAGADIAEMAELGPLQARRFADLGHRVCGRLERLEVPTLAAVNGFALGGGLELAMACDLVYASERARLGQPEVNLGLIPGFGGTQRLLRRVGIMRAKEMIFTGATYGAEQARDMGLVLEVVPHAQLLPFCLEKARLIASRGPVAVAQAKRAIQAGADVSLASGCELEREAFALLFGTADAAEGMRAFVEKRSPSFRGA